MTAVSITEAKNNLSKLLKKVKHGESVLILDRKVPVACLEPLPCRAGAGSRKGALGRMERRGRSGRPGANCRKIFGHSRPKTRDGSSVLQALLDERAESR